jgi:UDP-glucose 4-epimerase
MAKILVTGGAGYIGSHTVVALVAAGHDVVIVDDFRRTDERIAAGLTALLGFAPAIERVDVADVDALTSVFTLCGPIDVVIHFAAYKSVKESVQYPMRYYTNNVGGTASLLRAMQRAGCKSLVFSSSCTVYGSPDALPVTEQTPLSDPASPYGFSKYVCEQMISDVANGVDQAITGSVVLRYFNPAGAHRSALIGELPIGTPENLVPFITQTAAQWHDKLSIFGGDYETPDGTAVRDYLHVEDLAEAHTAAVDLLLSSPDHRVYNLGTGVGVSVMEMVRAFEEATGIAVPIEIAPRRSGDIAQIWSSCERANVELGWKARRSLVDMMSSAWAWQQTLSDPDRSSSPPSDAFPTSESSSMHERSELTISSASPTRTVR